ncbi:hypothetical protein AB3R30_16655 [Leptolyngbyaceae cyanobacterium UHCC 1019]
MTLRRFSQLLHRAGWEFWLPLPLIAVLFWVAGHSMAAQVLSRPYDSLSKLRADRQPGVKLSVTILAMNAEIDRRRSKTIIFVRTMNFSLKSLEYEFPVVQASQVETAIAQKLEMPVETVRKLISYRFVD